MRAAVSGYSSWPQSVARTVPPLWPPIGYGHDLSLKTAGLLASGISGAR